jgi:drug/metabolite transporter (DMT)-like permease
MECVIGGGASSLEGETGYSSPMASLLALFSSVLWGTADFLGGNLAKRYKSLAVTGMSQVMALVVGAVLILISGSWISPTLSWNGYFVPAIGAGIAGFLGLTAFYAGLATGRMGVVSPISSLSAIIPLVYAYINGERPHAIQYAGMAIALAGAFCASGPEIVKKLPIKPLVFGLCAALGFGTALTFMAQGSKTSSLLTMTAMRLITVAACLIIALRYRTVGGFARRDLRTLAILGSADFAANYFIGVATTKGLVSVAMVLGSLFPIVTSLLAFKFLHERLHKVQYLGIVLAVGGVALISLNG